jgi:hypothetical protein
MVKNTWARQLADLPFLSKKTKMKPNQHEEKFSEDPDENLHIENQILKLKLQAESGANFFMNDEHELPPEVENDFLKQVQMFEEAWQNVKQVKVYELIGSPEYKNEASLTDTEVESELENLHELLHSHNMSLNVIGEYEPRVIYKFITEELFIHETDDLNLPGWSTNFIYEEFHPNHSLDIRNRANEFVESWLERRFCEYSWELGDEFVLSDGRTLSKEILLLKFNRLFELFAEFKNSEHEILDVSFKWDDQQQNGIGHAEGFINYEAVLENGEIVSIGGPFKLYMSNEHGWWRIFYFDFPGFNWNDKESAC